MPAVSKETEIFFFILCMRKLREILVSVPKDAIFQNVVMI